MVRSTSNRRRFLSATGALLASGPLVPSWLMQHTSQAHQPLMKNDRPHVGVIGVGERGLYLSQWAATFGDIVAVCDADLRQAEKAKVTCDGVCAVYQDYRRLLDRNDLDVIVNATPDHWHTAINIAACRSGRDVYTEKPLTLTIEEGKRLCQVVEETGRIVQVGTMQRSSWYFQTAVELVRNGRLGRLKQVWVALPYLPTKGGPFRTEPVPPQLDWDLWQGQALVHPYCPQRARLNFRWWFEYSGGMLTDWGNHHLDIAHWGMNCELGGPTDIEARGLFPNPQRSDCYNTPDRFFARMLYPNGVELLLFSSINARMRLGGLGGEDHGISKEQIQQLFGPGVSEEIPICNRNGIMFIGEQGRIFVNRDGVHGRAAEELEENPLPADAWCTASSNDHMADFFASVRTRKPPCAPVQIEHRTTTACHLANISLRLKRKIRWDPTTQQILGDDEANAWQSRQQRAPYLVSTQS